MHQLFVNNNSKSFIPSENKQAHPRYSLIAFTLLELLIVMAILAILASILLVVVKPQQIFARARDTQRIANLGKMTKAIQVALTENPKLFSGNPQTVYLSLQDTNTNCSSFTAQLPSLPSGWLYVCSNTPKKTDGTGWIPINFISVSVINLDSLDVDPLNNANYYYSYVTGGSFELNALQETAILNFKDNPFNLNNNAYKDGGDNPYVYEAGDNQNLTPSVYKINDATVMFNQLVNFMNNLKIKSGKTLLQITSNGCSACSCWANSPPPYQNSGCVNAWQSAVNRMNQQAQTSGLAPSFNVFQTDIWGSPYILDENELEFNSSDCRADYLRVVGQDKLINTGDDTSINILNISPQCR